MKLMIMEPSKTIRKEAKNWKELYDILANYGVFKDYSENGASENDYESFIKNKDARKYAYDMQKETNKIVINYLDVYIEINI